MNSRPAAEQVLGLLNFWWLLLELPPKSLFENWLWHSNFAQSYQKSLSFQINESKLIWYSIGVDYYLSITCKIFSRLTVEEFTVWSLSSGQSVTASRRATLVFSLVMPRPISHLSPSSVPLVMSLDQRRVWLATKKTGWVSLSLKKSELNTVNSIRYFSAPTINLVWNQLFHHHALTFFALKYLESHVMNVVLKGGQEEVIFNEL